VSRLVPPHRLAGFHMGNAKSLIGHHQQFANHNLADVVYEGHISANLCIHEMLSLNYHGVLLTSQMRSRRLHHSYQSLSGGDL